MSLATLVTTAAAALPRSASIGRQPYRDANDRLRELCITAGAGTWALLRTGGLDDARKRDLLRRWVLRHQRLARLLGLRYIDGKLTTAAWFLLMLGWLLPAHRGAALILEGEPDTSSLEPLRLDPESERETERRSLYLAAYLHRFRRGLETPAGVPGHVPMDGRVPVRCGLYALSCWGLAEGVRRNRMRGTRTMLLEKRNLGVADHCPQCPPLAAAGWQPIGTLPAIGDTICGGFCACWFSYR